MEALLGILFIVIVIGVIWWLVAIIPLLLAVGIISVIVCGGGIALMFLTLYLYSVLKTRYLNSEGKLGQVIEVEFDGRKLSWFVDDTLVKSFAESELVCFLCIMIGVASMLVLTFIIKETGDFKINLFLSDKQVPEVVNLYISSMISAIAFIKIVYRYNPKRIFECWMVKQANALMSRVEKRVEGIEDLRSLEDSINSEATEMETTFPIDVQTEIQDFVDSHKMEILSDVTGLNKFISKKIEQATNDLVELQKKNGLYQEAMELYTETVHEVNKTGSISLIKELDYDYEGLTSTNLKTLVSDRKWNEFNEVVNSIIGALERVSEKALKYQEVGYEVEAEDYYEGETDEERAYRILGVPSTASPEQIKKVYHALSHVYHEDKGIVEDDTHMKEINWAYDFLKDLKHFT